MNETLRQFAAEVARMREAQKRSHAVRQDRNATSSEYQEAVVAAKQAERMVDWWLRKLSEDTEQVRMFVE